MVQDCCVSWGSGAGGQIRFYLSKKKIIFLFFLSILACPQAGTAGLFSFHKLHYVSHILSGDVVPTWTLQREGATFLRYWV